MAAWSYGESLEWLYARQALGIKLGLAKVERLLAALGDPHRAFRSIHVAGTNGKGSVTRMMAETLRRSGYHVGATTSPHLVSFTERIEIDGTPVSKADVASHLAGLRPAVEALDRSGDPPTFFEVVTALAFVLFREARVEWAVVETGMGGRLDATNVLHPELAIITNVDLDHQRALGDTVAQIAAEKAGIMKPGVPCVTAARGEALRVLSLRSHEVRSPMSIVGWTSQGSPAAAAGPAGDYLVVPDPEQLVLLRPTGESRFQVGLAGAHQRENAAVAVAAVEALRRRGVEVPERALRDALRTTRNPGRLDLFQVEAETLSAGAGPRSVCILVDGAHNVAGARALRQFLFDQGWSGFHLVAGFCADKDWTSVLDEWLAPCAHLWGVPVRNPRSLDPARIREAGVESGVRSATAASLAEGLRNAVADGAERIVVAGSLFLAAEALAVLRGQSLEEIRGTQ
jgi:dihydrofolate synthase/folylpolyglutamate synthase